MSRGCGSREPGGLYLETLLGPRGRPIEDFLFDPPKELPREFEIKPRGITLIKRPDNSGVVDVYDHIGTEHYPNVADFIEETRCQGLSRRAPKGLDYSGVSRSSIIYLLHQKATVENASDMYLNISDEDKAYEGQPWHRPWSCLTCKQTHHDYPCQSQTEDNLPTCASLWYQMVKDGDITFNPDADPRTVSRMIGDTEYYAKRWFDKHDQFATVTPVTHTSIFMRLPIHRFAIMRDPEGTGEGKAIKAALRADLLSVMVDE